jgi:predicted nuclease of restriction endonuclease-like RecB superfamily
MRSSYELAYANYLDKEGVDWEYEPQYILSNGMGYAPDFRLGDGTIIEIKGFWTEKARAKWDLFCSDNVQLPKQVIMKQDLLNLGLEVT